MTVLRSARVTLRHWRDEDLAPFAAVNDDPEVTRHLSGRLSRDASDAFMQRIREHFASQVLYAADAPA